jgi:type III restriction enzyme
VVLDSDWEAELARVLESHHKVRAYVKNQGMQFEVPYRDGAVPRKYIPDFIVQVDDGRDAPFNLVLETKGYRGGNAQLKAETMRTLWVPGVSIISPARSACGCRSSTKKHSRRSTSAARACACC